MRNQHGSSMIAASVRGWKSASQTDALIGKCSSNRGRPPLFTTNKVLAFYTNLLTTIGVTPVVAAPEDTSESAPEPDGSVNSDILDGDSINPNKAEDEGDDDINSVTDIPSLEAGALEAPAWKKATSGSRDNTLALIIQTVQRAGGKNKLG